MSNDTHVKRQLIGLTDAARKKFNSIENGRIEGHSALQKFYEPIRNRLEILVQTIKKRKTNSPQKTPTITSPPINRILESTLVLQKTQHIQEFDIPKQPNLINTPPESPHMEFNESKNLNELIETRLYNVKIAHPDYDGQYGVRYKENTDTFHIGMCSVEFGE